MDRIIIPAPPLCIVGSGLCLYFDKQHTCWGLLDSFGILMIDRKRKTKVASDTLLHTETDVRVITFVGFQEGNIIMLFVCIDSSLVSE